MQTEISGTVLLIEDNPADEELVLKVLRKGKPDRHIHVVHDGEEALEWLYGAKAPGGSFLPRLILLDIKLPKIDGLEVLETVKKSAQTADIPVVVFTSSREPGDINASYRLGANSYIVKPVMYPELVRVVEAVDLYWFQTNTVPFSVNEK